jgi:hypothetical protein
MMPRPCQRACLESGLKLDINRLARRGFIRPGGATGPVGIRWTNSYFDEEVASGIITTDMSGRDEGWFRIQIGQLDQRIILVARPRHFGGRHGSSRLSISPRALTNSYSSMRSCVPVPAVKARTARKTRGGTGLPR